MAEGAGGSSPDDAAADARAGRGRPAQYAGPCRDTRSAHAGGLVATARRAPSAAPSFPFAPTRGAASSVASQGPALARGPSPRLSPRRVARRLFALSTRRTSTSDRLTRARAIRRCVAARSSSRPPPVAWHPAIRRTLLRHRRPIPSACRAPGIGRLAFRREIRALERAPQSRSARVPDAGFAVIAGADSARPRRPLRPVSQRAPAVDVHGNGQVAAALAGNRRWRSIDRPHTKSAAPTATSATVARSAAGTRS